MAECKDRRVGLLAPQDRLQHVWLWGGGWAMVALILVGCGSNTALPNAPSNTATDSSAMVVTTPEAALVQHLAATGSTMYGAYWCPHCADQKAMFGDAVAQLPYVECADDGENAQPELCRTKGIQAYPTWEINGQLYPGVKSLEDLAQLSGYTPAQ